MERAPTHCSHCEKPLYGAVAFCPYCGTATHAAAMPAPARDVAAPATSRVQPPGAADTASPGAAAQGAAQAGSAAAAAPAVPSPPLPAAAAASMSPPVPPAPPAAASPGTAPAPASAAPRPARRGGWVLLGLASAGMVAYLLLRDPDDGPCQQGLAASARLLADGDATGARSQAVLALGSCQGDARGRARELQASADQALAAQAACDRALRDATAQLAAARLRSARNTLDGLGPRCARDNAAAELRRRIEQAQQAADTTEDGLRKLLALGDLRGAQVALDRLQLQNREQSGLADLRAELRAAVAAQSPSQARPPVVAAPPPLPPPAPRPAVPPAGVGGGQLALVQGFLRDAEQALAQSKFDAARTYVDSARRIDPDNAQAASLLRRIREREMQLLREETTIR